MAGTPGTITVAAGQICARLMNEAAETLSAIETAIDRAAERRVDLLVLPECAYPAYLLGSVTSYRSGDHLSSQAFLEWLSGRAARRRLHLVCGLVEDDGDNLHNTAVLLDDRGREIGRTRKRFLWHMDHDWYQPGEEAKAFDTAIGRIGIVICAETRDPELVATLVADGAELIAMPTCWINAARDPGSYQNAQVEFLIEARAREFCVPFVCADKSGLELGAVGYVGQSRIVRADGSVAAAAPPTGETVVAARIQRRPARRVWVTDSRKKRLASEAPPGRPAVPPTSRVTVAALPGAVAAARFQGGMGETLFEPLRQRGVSLLAVNMSHEAQAEQLEMLARAFDMHASGFPHRADVFDLGPARVGSVSGQWVRSFAPARAHALNGAHALLFFDMPDDLAIVRARAMENRVFVLGVSENAAAIISPDGEVLARTGPDRPAEAIADIDLAQAADKNVAPRTDVFTERKPHLYRY